MPVQNPQPHPPASGLVSPHSEVPAASKPRRVYPGMPQGHYPANAPQYPQPAPPNGAGLYPQPSMPQMQPYGVPQGNAGFNPQPNQLAGGFQNMSLTGSSQPTGVNLMAGPPPVAAFDAAAPSPKMNGPAVTQSPFSNPDPLYKRCTLNNIPQTGALLGKSRLPFGLLITPYRHLLDGETPVPVIQAPQIVRCRRCRTYINPWVQFIEQGTRWKCNVCLLSNDVPSFFDWDPDNRSRVDRLQRPELTHGVVEFVAPQEYMVRPPQPVVFVFVIDVSFGAVQSGMVAVAARAILSALDGIPNTDDRTKVGFITFDSSMHYYNLAQSQNTEPQMLVVSDLDEPFMPIPYDLLVSLTESRAAIESFLLKLPSLFGSNQQTLSAMGKALKCAEKMIGSIGGKIVCLQHSLPNHDEGQLKMRDDPKASGTAKESALLQPAVAFYKNFAVSCSPNQVSIDLFLFNPQYADIATLSGCAKFTGGGLYYYQGFSAGKVEDALKFTKELHHLLTRPLGLEAVLRIRASKGIKMSTFHGNFFLRSTDLLSLPNVNPDNSYTIELAVTEDLKSTSVCFQTALLYTSSCGERRIRVLTLCVPVTSSLSEVYIGADQYAIAGLLIKKAVDRSLTSKIEDARDALVYKLTELLAVYKSSFNQASHPQQLMIADNLQLLPSFILGMIKNVIFREGNAIPSDLRSYMLALHYVLCPEIALTNIYPRLWSLQNLLSDATIGLPGENGAIVFPPRLNLSSEKLSRGSVFLLDNGLEIFFWVGRSTSPDVLMALFGISSLDSLPLGKATLPVVESDYNRRLHNLVNTIREARLKQCTVYPHVYVAREDGDPSLRLWFLSHFVEDRIDASLSYPQFLASVREKVQKTNV
ncbi:COPII subunit [Kappamyces sp. JEL0829]|nr:COPII subunit [Kappamyces sp. JEL0829]